MAARKGKAGRVLAFGKHRGEPVGKVIREDPDYIVWVVRNTGLTLLPKEEEHLNRIWKERTGTPAVLTYKMAAGTPYHGPDEGLQGKTLGELRDRDLYRLAQKDTRFREHKDIIIKARKEHRSARAAVYGPRRTPMFRAPVFQTDDI